MVLFHNENVSQVFLLDEYIDSNLSRNKPGLEEFIILHRSRSISENT